MRVSLIVAMAENRTIGVDGDMPWHISGDLRNFRQLTLGHPVVMGRKTYQSIGGALPGRANIVVTRDRSFRAPDADVVHDLEEALVKAAANAEIEGVEEVFVIGGAEIYAQAVGRAQRVYLTEVHQKLPGNAFFPELARNEWTESARQLNEPETDGGPAFSFVVLDRVDL